MIHLEAWYREALEEELRRDQERYLLLTEGIPALKEWLENQLKL